VNARRTIMILAVLIPAFAQAQISPGKLARVHQELEGIAKCTTCHLYGKTLSNVKCLGCHKEIKESMDSTKGVHAHVGNRSCAECHSDHNGEEFQIVVFDSVNFDHRAVAGFPLDGKHAGITCDSCHAWRYVTLPLVKELHGKRTHTYKGLSPACLSCHQDIHSGQFTTSCSSCHDTKGWKPASRFSHDRSRYVLTGKHKDVECKQCHNGRAEHSKAVLYRGMPFATCESCHRDPHLKKFSRRCDACHATEGWAKAKEGAFDHQRTEFPLNGKHADVKCMGCHGASPRTMNAGGAHGFHISRFKRCADCHKDDHGGQFVSRADSGKCEACHSDKDFRLVEYTVESHAKSRYPLTGAHIATNCIACHKADIVRAKSTRQFRWEKNVSCLTCHSDPHKGQFDKEKKTCESCHTTTAWTSLLFDHSKSKFPLLGKHVSVQCGKCHEKKEPVPYVGVSVVCASCHNDPHAGQFARGGVTRCEPCHGAQSWHQLTFDHGAGSRFALSKAHADVACGRCHPTENQEGKAVIRYKPLGVECEDCHRSEFQDAKP
jgi:hypothetical protein